MHVWLKSYVYMRLITPGRKPGTYESTITFVVSGLWHGFYPCYIICFGLAAIMQELAKDIYKTRVLFSAIPQPIKTILAWLITWITLNYFGVCIGARSFERVLRFNQAVNFFVFASILIGFPVWRFFVLPYARKLEKKKTL